MPKRQKGYHSDRKKNKRGNASKGRKGKGPPVDDPPVDGPPVDGPPVEYPPVDDPPEDPPVDGSPVGDPPVDGTQADTTQTDTTQTESSLSTAETLLQSNLGVGEDFTATSLPTEDAIDTDSETDIDPTDADVEEDCFSHTKQEAAAGGQMSGNGTRPNEEAGRSSTGPGPPADAGVKGSESTVQVASAGGNMSGNGTRPKTSGPVSSTSAASTSTSSSAEPVDWKELDHYIDIGFSVVSMDNVTTQLIDLLAYSISSTSIKMSNLLTLISAWQSNGIKVPYANSLPWVGKGNELIWWSVLNMVNGYEYNSEIKNIFLDVFGVTFDSFFVSDERDNLSTKLVSLIAAAYQQDHDKTRLHTVPEISVYVTEMVLFLQKNTEARAKFFNGLIVDIIRTAEWTVSTLNTDVGEWGNFRKHEHVRSRYQQVRAMIRIRNDVIHKDCKFPDLKQELEFRSGYQSFIKNIRHEDIHPAREPAEERERLEKPLKDAVRFKKLPEDYEKLRVVNKQQVVQLKDNDDEITQLNREIETQNAALARSDRAVTELTQTITEHEQTITGHEQTITRHEQTITRHEQTITGQQQTITELSQTITGQQ